MWITTRFIIILFRDCNLWALQGKLCNIREATLLLSMSLWILEHSRVFRGHLLAAFSFANLFSPFPPDSQNAIKITLGLVSALLCWELPLMLLFTKKFLGWDEDPPVASVCGKTCQWWYRGLWQASWWERLMHAHWVLSLWWEEFCLSVWLEVAVFLGEL